MKNNIRLRQQIIELGYEISGDIDHAECFYDLKMLNGFLSKLDEMKKFSIEYYRSNIENEGDEE